MNKDQLKAAFAKGARIQAWRLNEGAVSSIDGFWDTFRHEPAFTCPEHLYRVHPDDLSLIAEPGQEVGAVAWEYRLVHTNHPSRAMQSTVPMLTYNKNEAFSAGCISQRPLLYGDTSPAHTSEARDADVRTVLGFIFRHFGQHWNVGPELTDDVVAAVRRLEAAMRQEGGE